MQSFEQTNSNIDAQVVSEETSKMQHSHNRTVPSVHESVQCHQETRDSGPGRDAIDLLTTSTLRTKVCSRTHDPADTARPSAASSMSICHWHGISSTSPASRIAH